MSHYSEIRSGIVEDLAVANDRAAICARIIKNRESGIMVDRLGEAIAMQAVSSALNKVLSIIDSHPDREDSSFLEFLKSRIDAGINTVEAELVLLASRGPEHASDLVMTVKYDAEYETLRNVSEDLNDRIRLEGTTNFQLRSPVR